MEADISPLHKQRPGWEMLFISVGYFAELELPDVERCPSKTTWRKKGKNPPRAVSQKEEKNSSAQNS